VCKASKKTILIFICKKNPVALVQASLE
jgi:hypothetical protein